MCKCDKIINKKQFRKMDIMDILQAPSFGCLKKTCFQALNKNQLFNETQTIILVIPTFVC